MGYAIDTVTGGLGDEAHYKVLEVIQTLAEANGWTTLRYVDTGADQELILQSAGLSTTEDIYVGFKTYQNVGADYYNIKVSTFVGYIGANSFEGQPGANPMGVPCHNNAVTYFITANPQRITGCFKVGTPAYEHFYVGKMFVYGRPSEYPSPLVCAGMFNGPEASRYSEVTHRFPYFGKDAPYPGVDKSFLWLRNASGEYERMNHEPWFSGTLNIRPPGTNYQLRPIMIGNWIEAQQRGNVFGELDGIRHITGFNNSVENVMQQGGAFVDQTGMTVEEAVDAIILAGGRAHVALQDVSRNGFDDYIAMEMS